MAIGEDDKEAMFAELVKSVAIIFHLKEHPEWSRFSDAQRKTITQVCQLSL